MMMDRFNLIDRPWVPCLRHNGERVELSLHDTLAQAHLLREIRGDSPLETTALHRLLLAGLHRVFGPKDRACWAALWKSNFASSKQENMLNDYFYRPDIHERFDLFHPRRPFYQSLDERAGRKSVISMVLQMASGANATLFDHHTEDEGTSLSPAQAARALITSQCFGFGGLSGLPEKFTDAPCAKGIIFLAAGDSLLETLLLSLVRYYNDEPIPVINDDDVPAWEMEDPFAPLRNHPKGYLDYLTWQNRKIQLFPEETSEGIIVREMCWAPGLRLDAEDIDPMKQYIAGKDGYNILCFQPDRRLWRDSTLILQLANEHKSPTVVKWLADLAQLPPKPLDKSRQYRLLALGMAKSRASLDFFRSESLPLSIEYLTNREHFDALRTGLELAEKVGELVYRSSFLLAWLILSPSLSERSFDEDGKIDAKIPKSDKVNDQAALRIKQLCESFGIQHQYWSRLEVHFYHFLQDLPQNCETAQTAWHNHLRQVAWSAFTQAQNHVRNDRRAQRAIVKADEHFRRGLAKLLDIPEVDLADEGDLTDDQEETDRTAL
jgi:CRISPR system Cascade subunit CasA